MSGRDSPLLEKPPSDRELTSEVALLAIREQFPELRVTEVQHLGSGWEYDAYLADRRLVFRFPRYAEVAADLDKAETRTRFVAQELRGTVVVPRIVLRGEAGSHFPYRFFAHDLIEGVSAAELSSPPSADLASDLGLALTRIHSIRPERAVEIGAGEQKWDCASAFSALVQLMPDVPAIAELVPEGVDWVRSVSAVPDEYSGPPRFIHDDLQPEHIIVRPDSGRLSGIIDWGGNLGDPAQDFTFLVAWAGWDFARLALDSYEIPLDEAFETRLLFLSRVRAMGWLAFEVQVGQPTRSLHVLRSLLAVNGSF